MKIFHRSLISSLCVALLAGCAANSSREEAHDHQEEHAHSESGVTFNPKHGVHVPAETAAFLGLKTAEVEDRLVKSRFQFSAQVHRAAKEGAETLASGDVSPEEARIVRPDQRVTVQLDGGGSRPGRVTEVHGHTDKSVEHFDVTIAIDDREQRLSSGTFVTVQTPTGSDHPVPGIPRSALLRTAEGSFVYALNGEHFLRTSVKTGVINNDFVEITDGLYAGDKVVTHPVLSLWMAELQSIRGGEACADGH